VPVRTGRADDLADVHVLGIGLDEAADLAGWLEAGECLVHVGHSGLDGLAIVRPRHFYGRDFVDLLLVSPDSRRQGVGRLLLREAVRHSGTVRVFTSTNRSNLAMQGLLAAEGWCLSGQLDGLDEGDPELVYYVDGSENLATISSNTRQDPP
jgi:GNAT superfamily N-acetyltransferase